MKIELYIGDELWKEVDCNYDDMVPSVMHFATRKEGTTAMIFRKFGKKKFALLKAQGRYTDEGWQHQEDTNWWYEPAMLTELKKRLSKEET